MPPDAPLDDTDVPLDAVVVVVDVVAVDLVAVDVVVVGPPERTRFPLA